MSNQEDLKNLDLAIAQHQRSIKRMEALQRLEQNQDFKDLIEKGFLEEHAIRQVLLKAHPGMQQEAQQNLLDQQITAIGGLKQFLVAVFTEGMNAKQALAIDEETREEILREDVA